MPQKNYLKKIRFILKQVDAICTKHPEADRNTVYHTLLTLRRKPEERLYWSLLRAGKIKDPY